MSALAAVLGLLIMALWFGKRMQRVTFGTYTLTAVLAVLQVAVILIYMFTVEAPEF